MEGLRPVDLLHHGKHPEGAHEVGQRARHGARQARLRHGQIHGSHKSKAIVGHGPRLCRAFQHLCQSVHFVVHERSLHVGLVIPPFRILVLVFLGLLNRISSLSIHQISLGHKHQQLADL